MMLVGTKGNTYIEVLFTTVVLIVTVGVFAYIISSIGMLLDQIHKEKQEYRNAMEVMNRHMRINKIEKATQQKIRGYLEYVY